MRMRKDWQGELMERENVWVLRLAVKTVAKYLSIITSWLFTSEAIQVGLQRLLLLG